MPNIEIKAHYADLNHGKKVAEKLNAEFVGVDHQIDTYFRVPQGRLKLRESSLTRDAKLIPYVRSDQSGPKKSDYALLPVTDPAYVKGLFTQMLGVETVVDKHREIHLVKNVRVHLDEVKDLGTFLEFEAVYSDATPEAERRESTKVRELMEVFGVKPEDLLTGSYRELTLNRLRFTP